MRTGDPEEDETRFSNQSAFRCVSVLDRSSFTTPQTLPEGLSSNNEPETRFTTRGKPEAPEGILP